MYQLQLSSQQPGGRIPPLYEDEQVHQHHVKAMLQTDMGFFMSQDDRPILMIVLLADDDMPEETVRRNVAWHDVDLIAILVPKTFPFVHGSSSPVVGNNHPSQYQYTYHQINIKGVVHQMYFPVGYRLDSHLWQSNKITQHHHTFTHRRRLANSELHQRQHEGQYRHHQQGHTIEAMKRLTTQQHLPH